MGVKEGSLAADLVKSARAAGGSSRSRLPYCSQHQSTTQPAPHPCETSWQGGKALPAHWQLQGGVAAAPPVRWRRGGGGRAQPQACPAPLPLSLPLQAARSK